MNDQVTVSWQGMDQLVSSTRDQYLNLSEASGFMCSGRLADTGAFTGILELFRGQYQDALDAVTHSLDQAMDGAQALSQRIADVRDDLRRTDHDVSELHSRLNVRVACEGYVPHTPAGVPQLPGVVTTVNDLLDVDTEVEGIPDWMPGASTGAAVDLVDNTLGLADDASELGDTLDQVEAADDYVEEHGR